MPHPNSKSLLIEGWRGINHSFALVNQCQILELLKLPGLQLYHRDLPFAFEHWKPGATQAGFSQDDFNRIAALSEPRGPLDAIFRIGSPYRAPGPQDHRRTVTFMITELGLAAANFDAASQCLGGFTRDGNRIVTSSTWSRDRIAEHGFDAAKIDVVPLAVDTSAFFPVSPPERQFSRANLNIAEDETVFLNVGVAVWNKGIDVLLRAFAALRSRGRRVRLILKDQRDVYGVSIEPMIRQLGESCPALLEPATIAAISLIPNTLSREQLRLLYGIADAYVSPYRAEGFNLPVLEAISCGVPVIVTCGGATDDFCDDDVAMRIDGRAGQRDDPQGGGVWRFIEPDLDALIDAMDRTATNASAVSHRCAEARARVLARFNWASTARQLARICVGYDPQEQEPTVPPSTAAVTRQAGVGQQQVLEVLAMMQPRAMVQTGKIRVGATHDGGYVVPTTALACDVVVSIGVGSDVSFDLQLAQGGAQIFQFDHTVTAPPVDHENFTFHRLGWGKGTTGDLIDFDTVLQKSRVGGASHPLLKFDIEGAEYDVLEGLDPDRLLPFDILVCELHGLAGLGGSDFHQRVRRSVETLTRHHAPVHLHVNNYGVMAMVAGIPVPDVVEITLLRRDLEPCGTFSMDPIPGPLDRPNHPFVPDICLTGLSQRSPAPKEVLQPV